MGNHKARPKLQGPPPPQSADPEVIETSYAFTERRELTIAKIVIHDLWHVAMRVSETGDEKASQCILDVWALAHEFQQKLVIVSDSTFDNIPGTFEDILNKEIDAIGWHNVLAALIGEYEKTVNPDSDILAYLDNAEDNLRKIERKAIK